MSKGISGSIVDRFRYDARTATRELGDRVQLLRDLYRLDDAPRSMVYLRERVRLLKACEAVLPLGIDDYFRNDALVRLIALLKEREETEILKHNYGFTERQIEERAAAIRALKAERDAKFRAELEVDGGFADAKDE